MPRLLTPLSADLVPDVFSRAEAKAAGISDQRLRAHDIHRVARGLYARTDAKILEKDIVTALTRNDLQVTACGPTASRLWKFPQPFGSAAWTYEDPSSCVHMTSTTARRRNSGKIRWRDLDLPAADVAGVGGARLTSRVRTWLDLAASLPADDLTLIGDHLVRVPRSRFEGRNAPYVTLDQLREVVNRHHGRGARRLRQSLADIRVGSDSPAETRLRLAVLRAGLPAPLLNTEIRSPGTWLGEPDLSWPQWKVCVEHDGPRHLTQEQQDADIARTELRDEEGWIEVRTVAKDLRRYCARGLDRIATALRRHGWRE